MASSNADVSSAILEELQTDLTQLSGTLHDLFELMNADMTQVNEFWRDPKYEEFVSGYRPKINKCEDISVRYSEWCKRILAPMIDKVKAIETTDVGGEGSGTGGNITNSVPGNETNRPLSAAEKAAKFRQASSGVKKRIAESTPGPQGSGFDTPQNERPRLSPQQIANLLNGKQK